MAASPPTAPRALPGPEPAGSDFSTGRASHGSISCPAFCPAKCANLFTPRGDDKRPIGFYTIYNFLIHSRSQKSVGVYYSLATSFHNRVPSAPCLDHSQAQVCPEPLLPQGPTAFRGGAAVERELAPGEPSHQPKRTLDY